MYNLTYLYMQSVSGHVNLELKAVSTRSVVNYISILKLCILRYIIRSWHNEIAHNITPEN